MTLQARLIALVVGALLISLLAGGALIAVSAAQWVRSEIAADAQMARELVQSRIAEEAEETESPDRITELLRSLEVNHHLHARYLPAGGAMAAAPEGMPAGGPAPSWLGPLLGVRPTVQVIDVPGGEAQGGRIVLTTDPATGVGRVWHLITLGLAAMILFSLSTLALVAFGLTRNLRPLGQLSSGLTRIAAGDYSARVGEAGPSDLAMLGRHFDQMAAQLQLMQGRARSLTAQLLDVQERERRDIGRDLHDELGPSLLAANLDVQALIRLNRAGSHQAVEESAKGLSRMLARMQDQVRRMIGRLRIEAAEPVDLGAAAADLAGFWRERCPEIDWHVASWGDWPELPPADAAPLYRIVQEAISNAVRHSGARNIHIDCVRAGTEIVVRVRDDGSGIAAANGGGYGIAGMRERIEALGGSLDIVTAPGQGTTIAARLSARRDGAGSAGPRLATATERALA